MDLIVDDTKRILTQPCNFSEDPTSEIFGPSKGAAVRYLNSYKMEPDNRFNVKEVQDKASQVLTVHENSICLKY